MSSAWIDFQTLALIRNLQKQVDAFTSPVGVITLFSGSTLPDGWLLCNGATYSTTEYSELYDVIGYTYGGTEGNFAVPDLSNRFPIGVGTNALGAVGGSLSITLSANQLPSHTHSITDSGHSHSITNPDGANFITSAKPLSSGFSEVFVAPTTQAGAPAGTNLSQTGITVNNTGNGDAVNITPSFVALKYIISYTKTP
jgi:microcystin-dependent protein